MHKVFKLVIAVLLINFVLGYIFQLSNGIICFTELTLLAIGGAIFWISIILPIKNFTNNVWASRSSDARAVLILGGLGITVCISNLVFCFLFLKVTMYGLFGCESPAFQLLTASLTNNFAGNLLCYSGIVGFVIAYSQPIMAKIPHVELRAAPNTQLNEVISDKVNSKTEEDHILIKNGSVQIKLPISSVSHVMVESNCILISTDNQRFVKYQSLKSFLQEYSSFFIRIHRSTVVNPVYVVRMEANKNGDGIVHLQNDICLKYSRSYKKELQSLLSST